MSVREVNAAGRLEGEGATRPPIYLGDSVYAQRDSWGVNLWLNNGLGPKHQIHLEPEVYDALREYMDADVPT